MEETRDVVKGIILEAPVADLREVINLRSGEALPLSGIFGDSLLGFARLVTTLRVGIDFDKIDYVDRAGELDVPILLFHGVDDPKVPFAIGESLAEAVPDLVEFHPVPDGAHIRAWNEDPLAFAQTIIHFLERLGD